MSINVGPNRNSVSTPLHLNIVDLCDLLCIPEALGYWAIINLCLECCGQQQEKNCGKASLALGFQLFYTPFYVGQ